MFYLLKTNMRVDKDGSAEDGISDRVEGPGSERGYSQRYKNGGYQSANFLSAGIIWL